MAELIDKEFSPVLAIVHEKGTQAMNHQRSGTHAEVAPEVLSHMKALLQECRRSCDRLATSKRHLDEQEKRIVAELNEQRTIILGEMEREMQEARSRHKAAKDAAAAAAGGTTSSPTASASSSGSNPFPSSSSSRKSPAAHQSFTATLKSSGGNSAPPGDVDYWRAQAQDLALVVDGRHEALKSVQARIRSISHLNEHQARARGVIGLLRQAESAERAKAAEYLRQAHAIREQAGLAAPGSSANGGADGNNGGDGNNSGGAGGRGGDDAGSSSSSTNNASAIATLSEAETNGLEAILNALDPRLEVAKEANRMYTARAEKLQERLSSIATRRRQLSSIGTTLQQVTSYVNTTKAECADALAKVDPPNTAILNILKRQHSEALVRLARQSDGLTGLRLEVAELETQLRECRVNAIRSLHGTASGTTERLAQLRALKAAEVVRNQIEGIESECSDLRASIHAVNGAITPSAGTSTRTQTPHRT